MSRVESTQLWQRNRYNRAVIPGSFLKENDRGSRNPFMMKIPLLAAAMIPLALSQAGESIWLARLHSPDIAERRAAIDEIQTLDDPGIAEACLPLLDDEGNSIRRLAARAIGSRFDQIPPARAKEYVAALQRCAETTPHDGAKQMCARAVGLLTRNYSSDQFSVSPDGKWVLYERRRLPVIADVKRQVHTLLLPMGSREYWGSADQVRDGGIVRGKLPPDSALLKLAITNAPVGDLFRPMWHPQSAAVAFSPVMQMKFCHPICIWRASDGEVRTWDVAALQPILPKGWPHWGTMVEFLKWDGSRAVLRVYDVDPGEVERLRDPDGVQVAVDIRTWKMVLVH
jgi:hypothetical protein